MSESQQVSYVWESVLSIYQTTGIFGFAFILVGLYVLFHVIISAFYSYRNKPRRKNTKRNYENIIKRNIHYTRMWSLKYDKKRALSIFLTQKRMKVTYVYAYFLYVEDRLAIKIGHGKNPKARRRDYLRDYQLKGTDDPIYTYRVTHGVDGEYFFHVILSKTKRFLFPNELLGVKGNCTREVFVLDGIQKEQIIALLREGYDDYIRFLTTQLPYLGIFSQQYKIFAI
jgi:hypothetical protein